METAFPVCDLIVPVFNALTYTRDCLESIVQATQDIPYHLYLIDDASDAETARFLTDFAAAHPYVSLQRNPHNLGFPHSCNIGLRQGAAPYAVLMNSDVIVPPRWLSRLVRCVESDARIGAVNPLTNRAPRLSIPLALGATIYSMDWVVAQRATRQYPDVMLGVGFCWLLRRAALEEVGVFDEGYGRGYGEDADLCLRLLARGYRVVAADDVYVYHKQGASFPERARINAHSRRRLYAHWGTAYLRRQLAAWVRPDPLRPSRALFPTRPRWSGLAAGRAIVRALHRSFDRHDLFGTALLTLHRMGQGPAAPRLNVSASAIVPVTRPGRLRVTYVLQRITPEREVQAVIQLANALIQLGLEVRLVALDADPVIADGKLLTQPLLFRTVSDLCQYFPESDVAVATCSSTARWVAEVLNMQRVSTAVTFIQHGRQWRGSETASADGSAAAPTGPLLPHAIVTTDRLQTQFARSGLQTRKICLGLDLAVFYPRDAPRRQRPAVLALSLHARPLIAALNKVQAALPQVDIIVPGTHQSEPPLGFPYRTVHDLTDQSAWAELYSTVDVVLEGTGEMRPALEAMACGAACVLVGGDEEFTRPGDNCLPVASAQQERTTDAILQLLGDPDLRQHLAAGGRRTARRYDHQREARETRDYFFTLVGCQPEGD